MRCNVLFLASLLLLSVSCSRTPSSTETALPSVGDRLPEVARGVLESPETFEVLSMDPASGMRKPPEGATLFHQYVELGRAPVTDPATRRRIVRLVYEGILENDEMVAACFNPRHAIHATADGHVVDLVICYECYQIYVFVDGGERQSCLTGESVAPALSRIWRDHGLQIAK